MDLLIKGLAMPKNGEVLKLYLSDGFVGYQDDKGLHKATVKELPPHGRLGDLDNVRKAIEDWIEAMARSGITVDGGHLWRILNDALDNAPTIVEASK